MALKFRYQTREEIPAAQAALYVERDGAFVLDVDGDGAAVPSSSKATALEKQLSILKKERDGLNARLVAIQVDQGVVSAATKRGLRASALQDITARARTVFRLVDRVPTAFEADG